MGCRAMITQKDLDPQEGETGLTSTGANREFPFFLILTFFFFKEKITWEFLIQLTMFLPSGSENLGIYSKALEGREHKKGLGYIFQNSNHLVLTPASQRLTRQEAAEGASPQVLPTGPCYSLVSSRNRNPCALDSATRASQTPEAEQKRPDLDPHPSLVGLPRQKSSGKTGVGMLTVCLSLLFQSPHPAS